MKRTSKTPLNLQAEAKIIKALNYLRNNFSKTIGQPWDSEQFYAEVSITRTFATILKNMGVIEYPKKGHIKLTEKIDTITPIEVHKEVNAYQHASQKRNKKIKDKLKAKELAKIQAQIRFENKQKLRGFNTKANNDALNELLRNAPSLPNNDLGYQEALRNAVPPPPQFKGSGYTATIDQEELRKHNLFNVQGAYYPQMKDQLALNEIMDMVNSFLPKNYQIQDILNGYKAALREEIKDELRREIINELISKG
jgi:hypothetical protein